MASYRRATKRALWSSAAVLTAALLLGGCGGGVGIVAKEDPYTKLSQAQTLGETGRIAEARKQLEEAMAILEKRGDKAGLAEAYRQYGFIAAAGGLNANPVDIRDPNTPLKPSKEESALAIKNFLQAAALAADAKVPDKLSNIYFTLASYELMGGERKKGCSHFDLSLAASREAEKQQPGKPVQLPAGFHSFAEFVASAKSEANCPAT